MIELRNLSFAYPKIGFSKKKIDVLHNINLKITNGECVGLLGQSGCGKSTLAKILAGLQKPTDGDFLFEQKKISLNDLESRRKFYKKVQILFQDCIGSINPRLDIRTFIKRGVENLCEKRCEKTLEEILGQLQIPNEVLDRYSSTISGGQAARILLARSLLVTPQLLILDETTSSLDVNLQIEIIRHLVEIQKREGLTIIFITHDVFLARLFCSRFVLMDEGKILEDIGSQERFQSPLGKKFEEALRF